MDKFEEQKLKKIRPIQRKKIEWYDWLIKKDSGERKEAKSNQR